jgi:hypothetical protein
MLNSADIARGPGAGRSGTVPKAISPDTFSRNGRINDWDARRSFDLTGDSVPEMITVHARGPRQDSADVVLSITTARGDMLYGDAWNTSSYFRYTPRSSFSDEAASQQVLAKLKALLADSAFTSDGPSARLRNSPEGKTTGGIVHDAVLYDIKEADVRASHAVPAGVALTPPQIAEMDTINVANADVLSLASELKDMPTFTYHAGGELTYTISWSESKKRFVKIFSCC